MPDADRNADIQVQRATDQVVVRIPLAGRASEHWLALYRKLAHEFHPGRMLDAEAGNDRTWVIVRVPNDWQGAQLEQTLDAVSTMIKEATAMDQQSGTAQAQAEATIRAWWAQQQRRP